jgi:hypothetical protein
MRNDRLWGWPIETCLDLGKFEAWLAVIDSCKQMRKILLLGIMMIERL